MVKETIASLQKKISAVANNRKLTPSESERKLISLYKRQGKLAAVRIAAEFKKRRARARMVKRRK